MGIDVVMRGWDHLGWRGSFYPEDLPEDWRLAYFAHAFDAVLVPAALWREAAPEVLAGWAREVPPRFRFYLELEPGGGPLPRPSALGDAFAGSVASAPKATDPREALPSWPAWDPQGNPMLARPMPSGLTANPASALAWLRALATEAGLDPALAILQVAPAVALTRCCDLIDLAGLA
jgi:hypothetical protein